MHKLVEAVLSISAWFTDNDWPSVHPFIQSDTGFAACLSIALHVELLDVSGEPEQGLAIWQDRP